MPAPQRQQEGESGGAGATTQFLVFQDWSGGMDTQSARQGLPDNKAAFMENLQPVAGNFLLGVPAPAPQLATLAGEVVFREFPATIGTTDYLIIFVASGALYAVTVIGQGNGNPATGGVVTKIAPAGTFSGTGGDCTTYASQRVLLADSVGGYCTWDGTVFVRQGGVSPNFAVTNGGSGYTSPTAAITGGHGTGAKASVQVVGGIVVGLTLTVPGVGYLPGDALTVTISDSTGINATANGHVWPTVSPVPTSVAVAFGRVWLSAARTLIASGTGSATFGAGLDDFSAATGSVTTIITDADLVHSITCIRFLENFLYIIGDNSIKSIGSISISAGGVTSFTITTLSSDQGTIYPMTVLSFDRLVTFANTVGVFAVFGTSVQKISDPMDGIFRAIDFGLAPQAAVNDINNIHTYLLLARYRDPLLGTRALILAFSQKRWFVINQGAALVAMTTSILGGITETFASSTNDVTQILQNIISPIVYRLQTSLTAHGNPVRDKRVVRAGIAQQIAGTSDLALTIESEVGSAAAPLPSVSTLVQFTNNAGQVVQFTNNAGQIVGFSGVGFRLSHTAIAGVTGRFIGATLTGSLNGIAIEAIYLEYSEAAVWGRG